MDAHGSSSHSSARSDEEWLLAIADDAMGVIILAGFYPSVALSVAALGGVMTPRWTRVL